MTAERPTDEPMERYQELSDVGVRKFLEGVFVPEYRDGWTITDLVRMPDGAWLLKWRRLHPWELQRHDSTGR